jgi:2-desacetyl-2-hydroxyethyl bacteriochlorophyllide A dehydrogenase
VKAAILRELGKPLEITEIETPEPDRDDVLVQVMACGIDGTDLKLLDGFGYVPDLPFIMGHEVAGIVAEVGSHVSEFKPGDRVVIYNFSYCGKCLLCRTHREELCINMAGVLGARGRYGGYADYCLVPVRQIVPVPGHVPWPDAAICCDAGLTAYHALDRGRVHMGESVLIIGVGGVGSMVTQLVKLAGARAIVAVRSERRAQQARAMDADEVIYSTQGNVAQVVHEMTDGLGADCVIDNVGNQETLIYGFDSLRHGGRLVIVGYTPEVYPLNGKVTAQNEKEIIGSRAGRLQDLIDTVRLMASGKFKSIVTETFPLEKANEALAFLRSGKMLGRAVLLTAAGRKAMGLDTG